MPVDFLMFVKVGKRIRENILCNTQKDIGHILYDGTLIQINISGFLKFSSQCQSVWVFWSLTQVTDSDSPEEAV